jgi:elongation factor 1-gamma
VDAWVDFSSHEVELPASMWVFPVLGYTEFNKAGEYCAACDGVRGPLPRHLRHSLASPAHPLPTPLAAACPASLPRAVHDKAVEDLNKALATLERHLLSRTFVVGEAVTLADIVLVAALFYPFKLVLDAGARAPYPSVTRWFLTCVNQPAFRSVLGDVPLCEVAAGAAKGGAKKEGAAKKEAAPKADKPKAEKKEAAPKAEKPKAEKKEAEEKDVMDEIMAAEPKKAADPFAHLPKSAFIMDEWKRTYSNAKPNFRASMPWFWEHADKPGYTLWLQKYKYNSENKKDFMTSNLVGGFIQRSEEMRKYAFGMMHVLNAAAPFEVEGLWLIRGADEGLKLMLDSNPDAEYYVSGRRAGVAVAWGWASSSWNWEGCTTSADGTRLMPRPHPPPPKSPLPAFPPHCRSGPSWTGRTRSTAR